MDLSSSINPDDFQSQHQSEQDRNLLVRFYVHPRKNNAKSTLAGRPVFSDSEFIEIRTPGSRDPVVRPARPGDIQRFPEHYRRFKDRIAEPVEGTPLTEWPLVTRSMAEELAFQNIKTVEALASVADSLLSNFRGLGGFKRKAQDWLELAKNDAPLEQLNAELEKRDITISAQENTIKGLTERMEAMEKLMNEPTGAQLPLAILDSALDVGVPVDVPVEETTLTKRRRSRAAAKKE